MKHFTEMLFAICNLHLPETNTMVEHDLSVNNLNFVSLPRYTGYGVGQQRTTCLYSQNTSP